MYNLDASVENFATMVRYFTTNYGIRLNTKGRQLKRMDLQVHDDGTQLHHNVSSQLSSGGTQPRYGETTLDTGCNLIIVGMQLIKS
jgi:hypothetical protein